MNYHRKTVYSAALYSKYKELIENRTILTIKCKL